jgi:hypothetical protein
MRNILYASATDLGPALTLKGLIGAKRVARFQPGQHPLGAGFRALRTRLIGLLTLTSEEFGELGTLDFVARSLLSREDDWRENAPQLANDLARADECSAIIFELQVMRFALEGKVGETVWQRYREGSTDIICSTPDIRVECKLVRAADIHRDTIFDAISMARHQHKRQKSLPLVVAVGFERNLSREASAHLQEECRRRGNWFKQRRDVSAALVFLPTKPAQAEVEELGLPRVAFMDGIMLEIINHAAVLPLPVGFAWSGTRQRAIIGPSGRS